jgi:hypothetical protein
MSMFAMFRFLYSMHAAEVAEDLAQVHVEAGRSGAVDHAVVPGQAQRQHQARLEGLAVPHGFHGALAHTQNGHFRGVDDGREITPANAAQLKRW